VLYGSLNFQTTTGSGFLKQSGIKELAGSSSLKNKNE
jgi:hypothetical protein